MLRDDIKKIICKQLQPYVLSDVTEYSKISEDFALDKTDIFLIMLELEKQLQVCFCESDYDDVYDMTIEELIDFLLERVE